MEGLRIYNFYDYLKPLLRSLPHWFTKIRF